MLDHIYEILSFIFSQIPNVIFPQIIENFFPSLSHTTAKTLGWICWLVCGGLILSRIATFFQSDDSVANTSATSEKRAPENNTDTGSIRAKDFSKMIFLSLTLGFFASVICYFIWQNWYQSISNSFWISWGLLAVLFLPISYSSVRVSTSCSRCGKAFALSNNGQTDLENYVKYRNESVYENGVSRNRNVPYNCRRYLQHQICDNCGAKSHYQATDESRA